MIVYTLVGSLLMLVGAIATAILAADQVGELIVLARRPARQHRLGEASQDWIFWFFAAAFLVKMPAFLVHGWMPDAYQAAPMPVLALLSGVLVEGRRLRLPARRAAALSRRDDPVPGGRAGDRAREHPLRLGHGVHADERAAGRRLLVRRPARLHHARDLLPAPRRGRRRGAADGQPRARRRPGLHHRRAARRARGHRGPARDGRPGDARAGPRGAVPDRHAGDARDAGLGELHRRVLHPQRRLPGEDRDAPSSP